MAELAAFLPALISGGSALAGLFGGGPAPAPPVWHPPGMNQAAGNITSMINQNNANNVPQQLMPQYQQIVAGLNANPGMGQFMGGANAASGYGNNAAGMAYGGGNYLGQLASAIGNQAFDPQNALYGRTQHQLQEQVRAGSEARGLNNTPYGAGVENKAMGDFNIDWQNNLLQRMIGGGNAAGSLMNSGVNLSAMAPQLAYMAGQYPYQAFNTIGQGQLGNLGTLGQAGLTAQQIPNMSISQLLSYIGQGNQANQVSNQNAQINGQLQNMGFQQNQILGGQFGQAMNSLYKGGFFGGGSGGGGYTSQLPQGFTGPPQVGQTGWGG